MDDPTPSDSTQTFAGATSSSRSLSTTSAPHAAIEGRFPPGMLLNGRYRIIAMLGKGAMGEVYRATDLTLGQSIALKFLPTLASTESHWLERFHSEVRIARQVSHPNVCRVYDIGEAEGLPFLSMEYVDGEDLSTLIRRIGRLPGDKAVEISRKICAGLAAAHAKGIIHRDLKPHNIMLDRNGEILICDFGLAAVASEVTTAESRQGTPAYMAPEQLKGTEVTSASDIYALGLVLYELFTGKRPFSASNINDLLNLQESMSFSSLSSHAADIDTAVENIIRRCLDPLPANRPPSAIAVSAALPGGDPLAAALAAGQTPSPELVAASKSTVLPTRYSLPILAYCLLSLLALPFLRNHFELLRRAPLELPRQALETRARSLAAQFGYAAKPADWFSAFEVHGAIPRWLQEHKLTDYDRYFTVESPILFLYRQSPTPLAQYPTGEVGWNLPPLNESNSLRLKLNSSGYLRFFEALPPIVASTPPLPFNEAALFEAIGFDRSRFTPAEFFRNPFTPADTRVALRGPHPTIPYQEVTLQYGLFAGRLTSLSIKQPWSPPFSDEIKPTTLGERFSNIAKIVSVLAFGFFGIALARRNWFANRVDHRGAFRLFLFCLITCFLGWLMSAHFVADASMLNFGAIAFGSLAFFSFCIWLAYNALEPALRQRWPASIVTWNRVLAGRWTDPQVAAHVLMGIATGITIVLGFTIQSFFNFEQFARLTLAPIPPDSPGRWLSSALGVANGTILTGFLTFFVLFGLRVLLRRDWLAMLGGCIFLCALNGDLFRSKDLAIDLSTYFLIAFVVVFSLVRFGMLTTIVAVFTNNILDRTFFTNDLGAWFIPYSISTYIFLGALASLAFWRSLGDQNLFAEQPQ